MIDLLELHKFFIGNHLHAGDIAVDFTMGNGHDTAYLSKAGMFNLGWLPGGDKSVTTLRETTLPAIRDAIDLMDRDAILNIAVYPGHAEGDAEGKMIQEYLASVSRHRICATMVKILNSPTSPYFIVVETKPAK